MRRLLPFVLACLLAPAVAGPAAAAGSFSSFNPPWVAAIRNGTTFSGYSDCLAGYANTSEFRCAWEFDVRSIPAGQRITAATLKVTRAGGDCPASTPCPVTLQGYYGNGIAEVSDVLAGDTLETWTPTDNSPHSFDVRNFIQNTRDGHGGIAGFSLWSKGIYGLFQYFDPTKLELDVSYASEVTATITPVSADGVSTGVVTETPDGATCSRACGLVLVEQTDVTLTAKPNAGSAFLSWSAGPCKGSTNPICAFEVPSSNFDVGLVWVKATTPTPTPMGTTPTPHPTGTATATGSAPPRATPSAGDTSGPTGTTGASAAAPSAGASGDDGASASPTQAGPPASSGATADPGTSTPTSNGGGGVPVPIVILLLIALLVIGAGAFWLGTRRRTS